MRILHTSDWHLGRQFHHTSLLDDQRYVLDQIIELVAERDVDVLLVAGDVYDRSVPPADAITLLDETIEAINHRLGVPVVMIAGNHDGPQRLAAFARPLERSGVHIRGPVARDLDPILLRDEHGEVAFYALPYADPATVRDDLEQDVHGHEDAIALRLDRIASHNEPGRRCVVMSHCFLDGGEESESERPLSVGGVDKVSPKHFERFDYAALGHLHAPQYKGAEHVRYSGSLLKYSFSEERQRKSVTLVDLDAEGDCAIEKFPLVPRRDMRIVEGTLSEVIERAGADPQTDDYVLIRLLDKHAILDVMNKLREVYPNILHLERPALAEGGKRRAVSRERLERGHLPLFRDFYEQMTNQPLDEAAAKLVSDTFDRVTQKDR